MIPAHHGSDGKTIHVTATAGEFGGVCHCNWCVATMVNAIAHHVYDGRNTRFVRRQKSTLPPMPPEIIARRIGQWMSREYAAYKKN
jgi:hypothetical protein